MRGRVVPGASSKSCIDTSLTPNFNAPSAATRAESRLVQQVHRALLENAGTNGGFDIASAACLEHDRFNTAKMEKMGEQEARRTRTNNADLCTHECLRNAC